MDLNALGALGLLYIVCPPAGVILTPMVGMIVFDNWRTGAYVRDNDKPVE